MNVLTGSVSSCTLKNDRSEAGCFNVKAQICIFHKDQTLLTMEKDLIEKKSCFFILLLI
jgi:hypothetical protein